MILNESTIKEITTRMERYPSRRSAILPALTYAYRQVGHLNADVYKEISRIIRIPYVEIAEAASFYTMFPKKEVGRYLIQVCHNISCALLGADSLIGYLEEKLGIKVGETTPDGRFTLLVQECLAACGEGPVVQVNDKYHTFMTIEKTDALIEELKRDFIDQLVEEGQNV